MNFDFNGFSQTVFERYGSSFTLEEVQDLLKVDHGYDLDTAPVNKKRLFLRSIHFSGEKTSGDAINFSQKLNSGVTIWVADNLMGKSSLFKIIQFALTGQSKLKGDVEKWINRILLNFDINEDRYAAYLFLPNARWSARLYKGYIPSLDEAEEAENEVIIAANSKAKYEDQIQDFFFEQFRYYPLKWTSKASQKDKDELREVDTSWNTYFKSIYLQSKDTNKLMFGDQEKKVFQMLLGLPLTYPINRLTVKKEMLQYDGAKNKSAAANSGNDKTDEKTDLEKRINEINQQINNLAGSSQDQMNIRALYEEHDRITNQIKSENAREISFENDLQVKRRKLNVLRAQMDSTGDELKKVIKEIEATKKRIGDLEEYIQAGIFFSNLDIKHCPNCNHSVPENRKKTELENKTCSLCQESIDSDDTVNSEIYSEKIKNLELTSERLSEKRLNVQNNLEIIQKEYDSTGATIGSLEKEQKFIGHTEPLKNRLAIIEANINKEKEKAKPLNEERDKLVSERAVIEFRLKQFEKQASDQKASFDNKIELLDFAVEELNARRYNLSEPTLNRLSELMLSEIHGFGLTSITAIKIDSDFDILYQQDGDYITFDDIAEGEQLRVKLAFYLSLVQLEVEKNVGRHSKLLFIDSPAKEEGDSKYLQGLSEVLQSIDKRFGNKLQILIGTAERNLTGVVTQEHVLPEETHLF